MTKDLITDFGELRDFEPRHGDPPPPRSRRERWSGQVMLTTDQALISKQRGRPRATVVATDDLGEPHPLLIEAYFAPNNPITNEPVLPWTTSPAVGGPSVFLAVRRYADPLSVPIVDEFPIDPTERLPIDIVSACRLAVDARIGSEVSTATIWLNVVATPVCCAPPRALLNGWDVTTQQAFFAAVASPLSVELSPYRNTRRSLVIVNTSTNADMIIAFGESPGGDASWVGPKGAIVLPQNTFATWEAPSPVVPYARITASWNNVAPNGGALITEGAVL